MLYSYGLTLGLQAILRGHLTRESLKNIIVPVNYWRTLEYRIVFEELAAARSDRILDIGSPKLLSLYLADRIGAEVFSTDIERCFIRDYDAFRKMRRIPEKRFHTVEADGRNLQFEDGSFTKIFSISVLEHIPGSGDSECMEEIARTLKTGGTCVLTVPFSPLGRDEYQHKRISQWPLKLTKATHGNGAFFQRRYSQSDLFKRLIDPSGLGLQKLQYFGERVFVGQDREIGELLPPVTGVIHPLMGRVFQTKLYDSWQDVRNPLGALIVMNKS